MSTPLHLRAWHLGAVALAAVALTACSAPPPVAEEPDVAAESRAPDSEVSADPGPPSGQGSSVAAGTTGEASPPAPSPTELDARWYDLMHVQQTAPACASVWTVGNVLPQDYQWCADTENNPVAGVRVGPCEVVSYDRTMYAVPGRSIASVVGSIDQDQAYLSLLTSCKRRPFSPERR